MEEGTGRREEGGLLTGVVPGRPSGNEIETVAAILLPRVDVALARLGDVTHYQLSGVSDTSLVLCDFARRRHVDRHHGRGDVVRVGWLLCFLAGQLRWYIFIICPIFLYVHWADDKGLKLVTHVCGCPSKWN